MQTVVKPAIIHPEFTNFRKRLMIDLPIHERGNNSGVNSTRNLTRRPNAANLIGGPVWDKKKWGTCLTLADGSARCVRITPIGLTYNFFTFQYIFYVNSLGAANRRLWDDGQLSAFGISTTGVLSPFFVWTNNQTQKWTSPAGVVAPGGYYNMFLTVDCTNPANDWRVWLNGEEIQPASTAHGASGSPKTFTTLSIGAGNLGPVSFDGSIFAWRLWNRILPDREIQALTADPWLIYKKSPYRNANGIYLPN